MKKLLILISLVMVVFGLKAQSRDALVRAYIERYKGMAMEQQRKYGVPATITLAQGIVESGCGTSRLTRMSNNHFGIKAHKAWKGPVWYAKDDDPGLSPFRKYHSDQDPMRIIPSSWQEKTVEDMVYCSHTIFLITAVGLTD